MPFVALNINLALVNQQLKYNQPRDPNSNPRTDDSSSLEQALACILIPSTTRTRDIESDSTLLSPMIRTAEEIANSHGYHHPKFLSSTAAEKHLVTPKVLSEPHEE